VAYYVGLMSGTSMDGVDAVLVDFEGEAPVCHATHYRPFDDELRAQALALHVPADNELHRAALLANRLSRVYADSVHTLLAEAGVAAEAVSAVGCHGQTVRHAPADGYTIQLNNPALLAELTGIAVVADFRSRDIAAGGQGAPLVPAFHDAVFRHPMRHRVVLNIGGIANLTDLAPDRPTSGFDCGPGNMLLDAWAQRHLHRRYDAGGEWARQGRVLTPLLSGLLAHPFLTQPPPKSCGREQFNLDWLDALLRGSERPEDVQATLVALTADAAVQAIGDHCSGAQEIYVCGGGVHNDTLMNTLRHRLPACSIDITESLGVPADWVEAMAFAWLADCCLRQRPGNLPAVTGAKGSRVLGAVYPA
jgi:anhydro-N-acetylmuramic acid kinase